MRGLVKVVVYWHEAKDRFRIFPRAGSGATAVEYALLAAGIGIGILVSVAFYADNVSDMFNGISSNVTE